MNTMIQQIANTNYALKYVNYCMRKQTNEERYEGYMRSDFSSKKVPKFDSVTLIRLPTTENSK